MKTGKIGDTVRIRRGLARIEDDAARDAEGVVPYDAEGKSGADPPEIAIALRQERRGCGLPHRRARRFAMTDGKCGADAPGIGEAFRLLLRGTPRASASAVACLQ